MVAPIPEREFIKMVTGANCTIELNGSHGAIYRVDGSLVSRFAVSHKHGGKREIKQVYVRQFVQAIRERPAQ